MRRESGVLPVTAAITQAEERPAASRLWAFAKAAGAVIAVIPPGIAAYMQLVGPSDRVQRAQEIIEQYQGPQYADARACIAGQVQEVMVKLKPSAPVGCGTDRAQWSRACNAGRAAYKEAVVAEFEQMMSAPDTRKQFILIANYYMDAVKCVERGDCDRATIEGYFKGTIGLFWRQTWPYIEKAADLDVEYALWLRGYCGTESKCTAT